MRITDSTAARLADDHREPARGDHTGAANLKLLIAASVVMLLVAGALFWRGLRKPPSPVPDQAFAIGAGMADAVASVLPAGGAVAVIAVEPKAHPYFQRLLDGFQQRMRELPRLSVAAVELVPATAADAEAGVLTTDVISPVVARHDGVAAVVSLVGCAERFKTRGGPLVIALCGAHPDYLPELQATGAYDVAVVGRDDFEGAPADPRAAPRQWFEQRYAVIKAW